MCFTKLAIVSKDTSVFNNVKSTNKMLLLAQLEAAERTRARIEEAVKLNEPGSTTLPERSCTQEILSNLLLVVITGSQLYYYQRRQGCVEGGGQRE